MFELSDAELSEKEAHSTVPNEAVGEVPAN